MISIIDSVNILGIKGSFMDYGKVNITSSTTLDNNYAYTEKIDIYRMFGFTTCADTDPEITHFCYKPGSVAHHPCKSDYSVNPILIGLYNSVKPDIVIRYGNGNQYCAYKPKLLISVISGDSSELKDILVNSELYSANNKFEDVNDIIKSIIRDYITNYIKPKSIDERLQALEERVIPKHNSIVIWDDSMYGISVNNKYLKRQNTPYVKHLSDGVTNRELHDMIGCNTVLPVEYYVSISDRYYTCNFNGDIHVNSKRMYDLVNQHIKNPIMPDIVVTNNKDVIHSIDKLVIYVESNDKSHELYVNGKLATTVFNVEDLRNEVRFIIRSHIDSDSNKQESAMSEIDKLKVKNEELIKLLDEKDTKINTLQQQIDEVNSRIDKMRELFSS